MGLYLRKSVKVGPLRFNFSNSGIGVSTGIPGFRIGTGPRGAYVHMGAKGVYYRQALGGARVRSPQDNRPPTPPSNPNMEPIGSIGPLQEIESASVLQMTDSSASALLDEIQHRQALPRFAPWVGGIVAILLILSVFRGVEPIVVAAILAVGGGAFWWIAGQDAIRRTVIIAYDLEADVVTRYDALITGLTTLGTAEGLWHVQAEAQVHDQKYHAGASAVIKRTSTSIRLGSPPIIKTNIDIPAINIGKQDLFFFPDRLMVFEGSNVGAISYRDLRVELGTTRFIEDGLVPRDAQIVGQTWRYVNKKGGPDKRFKDNRELPIAHYETVHFRSTTGLNELLHVSRTGLGEMVSNACVSIAEAIESV